MRVMPDVIRHLINIRIAAYQSSIANPIRHSCAGRSLWRFKLQWIPGQARNDMYTYMVVHIYTCIQAIENYSAFI